MEYLLLVYMDKSFDFKSEEAATFGPDVLAWVDDVDQRGIRVQGSALTPMRQALTIRANGGTVDVAEGSSGESGEYIAGFDVLRCADRDEAIAVASKHPVARFGRVELRPCLE